MKLGDIYKSKYNNEIIQINSFAIHMNNFKSDKDMIIVFNNIEKHNDFEIGYSPSDNGYGTQEEIENEYEILIPQHELSKYPSWNEVFKLVE